MKTKTKYLLILLGTVVVLFFAFAPSAMSRNSYLSEFNSLYGTDTTKLDNCVTCHITKSVRNPYGYDQEVKLLEGYSVRDSLIAIEPNDSDSDTWINIDEIYALTFPGDSTDYPAVECPDADGDGYTDAACGGDDCNDTDPAINPGAAENCVDGIDNDCDDLIDANDSDCVVMPGDIFGGGQGARDAAITYESSADLQGKVTDFRDTGFQDSVTFTVYNNTGLIGLPVGDVTALSKDPAISISGLPLAGVAEGSTSATVTVSGLKSGRNTVIFRVNSGGTGDTDRLIWINP